MQPETANLNPGVPQPIPQPGNPSPPTSPPPDPGAVYNGASSKKKIIFIIIGVIIVLIVAVVAFLAMRQKPNSENAEITYWGVWEDEVIFQDLIQEFEQQNPNIKVKYEKPDIKNVPGGYVAFLKSRMAAGTGPDVFRFHNSWVTFLRSDLAPLPESVTNEIQIEKNYFPVINDDMQSAGAYYGVPLGYDSLMLFVNDEIVSAGGYSVATDWLTFLDVARSLTVIDEQTGEIKTSGAALGAYDNVAHAADIVSLLAVQSGVDIADLAGLGGSSPEESAQKQAAAKEKMAGALEFYTCFAIENDICTPIWNTDLPNSKLAFLQGKVAFYFGYSWDILELKGANSTLEFSTHPVPRLSSTNNGKATLAGYWAEGVSLKSKSQVASFEFVKFLSKKENLEKLYKAQVSQRPVGVAYPRVDLSQTLSDNPYLSPVVAQAPTAKSSLFYSETFGGGQVAIVERLIGDAVRSVQSGDKSTASAVDSLADGLQTLFRPNETN